jgi:hypothetical protein
MGTITEAAELAAKAAAKQTTKTAVKNETMIGIDALAKGIEAGGVSEVKKVDLVQLKKNFLAIKARQEQAEKAAKEAAKKEGAAPAPKPQVEKDHEDLGPVIQSMQQGETARFDLSSGDSYTVTRHNNASGESKASLEAISRHRQEQQAGQIRAVINENGTVTRIIGADAVDVHARQGQVVVQRGIGANEWTVLSKGSDIHNAHVNGILARAKTHLDLLAEQADKGKK